MSAAAPGFRPLLLACAAYGGATLLHIDRAPAWCTVVALAAITWRLGVARGRGRLPGTAVRVSLVLGLGLATLLSFRGVSGLAAGSALLVAMGAAKLLETRGARDARVVAGVALFLLLAACLDRQHLTRLPAYAAVAWLGAAAFAALGRAREPPSLAAPLRESGRALLVALPLALTAFVLFPRLPGALWALPGSERAQTGLSDEMSPGSISELTISDVPAFRVRFEGAVPPPPARYWRGPVLHDFDGYTWRRRPQQVAPRAEPEFLGEPYRYRVFLEPHGRPWWFALDTVSVPPSRGTLLTFDHLLLRTRPVDAPVAYTATSYARTRETGELSRLAQRMDTRLPEGRNPRTQALARRLRESTPDDRSFAEAALDHLRRGGFEYTLTPPRLDYDSVDDFLFNTRLGFCGHFASAYATLMRAGGVPARVVTGYLGGEWNAVGSYLLVRQSDAHAWTEVWLDGRGWVRIDPTAVVAPERLRRGLRDLLPETIDTLGRARRSPLLAGLLMRWDAANQWWRDHVVDYNRDEQRDLLARLGLPELDYARLALVLLAASALWAAVLLWRLRPQRGDTRRDAPGRAWDALRAQLARAGFAADPQDGPLDLARQAGERFPELADALDAIARDYARFRYGPPDARPSPRELAGRIRGAAGGVRRWRAASRHRLPESSRAQLAAEVPLYARLPRRLRHRVDVLAGELLAGVRFEGCGGLVLTRAMQEVIAVQACIPVAARGLAPYRGLRSVLVYPDEFVVERRLEDDTGVVTEGTDVLSGETQDTSRIVLSWTDIEEGLRGEPGYNVVLHEFAHLIDNELDGLLSRPDAARQAGWHALLDAEYSRLCDAVEAGEDMLIDPYGAEDPAEFFAVCTEVFFELPAQLRERHAGLYAQLRDLYGLDPAAWDEAATGAASPAPAP